MKDQKYQTIKDLNYQAIIDGLDLLVTGKAVKSKGMITGVNLAKEAGVSKSTLYRYFDDFPELRQSYNNSRKNYNPLAADPPETLQQALSLYKLEVKQLRLELAESKRNAESNNKLKAHQIFILWTENERLEAELKRLINQLQALKKNSISISSY